MLSLDLVYVWLKDPAGEAPIEMVRLAPTWELIRQPHEIGEVLRKGLEDDTLKWPRVARKRFGDQDISVVPMPLGLQGEFGVIAAGSQRIDFPGEAEKLVLNVAANQAAIGLQEARLRLEQKRIAEELDHRIIQRTVELAATNQELRREIAERKLTEEKLRLNEQALREAHAQVARSEERWRSVFENSAVGVALTDLDGRFIATNPVYQRIVGYTNEELLELSFLNVTHEDYLAANRELIGELLEGKRREFQIEKQYRRKNGSLVWVSNNVSLVPGTEREPRFLMALSEDITERKKAEEALRASEQQLRRSEEFLGEGQRLSRTGSFSWALETNEIAWSAEIYRIFEFEQDVPVTLDLITSRIHPEDLPLLSEMFEQIRAAAGDFEYEHRLLMPDKSVKYVRWIAHGTRDQQARVEYIGAVQDVTQRRLSEEALAQARSEIANVSRAASLGMLTASIAHEVNQPLSGIITNASTCLRMLAADPPNLEGARETARRAIRDSNRASDVISRLRTLYSKRDLSQEPMDLNETARDVMALSLSELQRNRVILRPELGDDLPLVRGDRVQLQQVILNLIRNASEAMSTVDDRPRDLVIRTERDEGDRVRLSVKDAGIGFDPESMDRLFEAFYTTKNAGMGIGLSVSRSIIEAHHGRLWAMANDGPGATFSFSIPSAGEAIAEAHSAGTA